ncbi:uncharacterized protein LOC125492792 [Beta vulgaris subsp. vulgaris]|uniref:uncharacterized protein LOC125492792 n=1 Tax=Beta vulgaris subsp. vulgaris TaxID=3555 RepID=UPI002037597A|nr:uncharacterized protein LOC125492792 [Beta vulgaris subsp. vulgaris]
MALQNKLATTDRLSKWNIPCDQTCSLCGNADETSQHLFFECVYAADIWAQVCQKSHTPSTIGDFARQKRVAITKAHGRSRSARIYIKCITETLYAVWKQRNNKIFTGSCVPVQQVVKDVLFNVACSCSDQDRMYLLR